VKVEVLSIFVLEGHGPDKLSLELKLPSGVWPYEGNAAAMLETAAGTGAEYVKKHFPGVPMRQVREER
jgi:hypothetical protein